MAILGILEYPDPRLKAVSDPVDSLDAEVLEFIEDLRQTLYDQPGCVGVAAPQVGMLKRIIIVDVSRNRKPVENRGLMILINPVIEWQQGAALGREGCLSLPHLTANVTRAQTIRCRAMTPEGSETIFETGDFEARVILHEADHLDGLLFLDRVSSLKTDVFRRKRYNISEPQPNQ